jgi:peptidoglycan/LPS O-acetylase OafA/YrhL
LTAKSGYRQDIQALRGIAVLLVLLFHAKIGGLAAGYLGVDIFFVLSGYLIAGLVAKRIAEARFSFLEFYLNRAKRLLPAAYVVYAVTTVAAYWLLVDAEFQALLRPLWGALTFTANISLWGNTDYFGSSAKLNALLHVWSLSLEEQFYILLPLALFLTPRRYWIILIALGGLASLALCFYFAPRSPVAAFYLVPTRAWELALGALLALVVQARGAPANAAPLTLAGGKLIGTSALIALIATPVFAPGAMLGSVHPGLDAVFVCVVTGVLIMVPSVFLFQGIVARTLARLGDISYAVYLVHWPLFALATNAYLEQAPPLEVRLGLLILAVLLAIVLYRWVEEPIRRRPLNAVTLHPISVTVLSTLGVVAIAVGISSLRQIRTEAISTVGRSANFGLDRVCEFDNAFTNVAACRIGEAPTLLVWGDSFAMHLVPGLAGLYAGSLAQATKSACGPILNLAPYRQEIGFTGPWARSCMSFNDSVIKHLEEHPAIRQVILSSPFSQFVEDDAHGLVRRDGVVTEGSLAYSDVVAAFIATIKRLQALNRNISVVGPTPVQGFNIGLCFERRGLGLPTFGQHKDCIVSRAAAEAFRQRQLKLLAEVRNATNITVVNPADFLCNDMTCLTSIDGLPLYWDGGHFSNAGSAAALRYAGFAEAMLGTSTVGRARSASRHESADGK